MKRLLFVVLTLVMVLALAAPAFAQDASNTLRIVLQQEPDTLSPQYTNMWFAGTVQDLIHAQAWWIDNTGTPVPAIAAEIPSVENGGLSEDGKVITVKIREGAVWSDGTPITADDFVFTYEMYLADGNTVTSRFPWNEKVASVAAADASTVVITTNEPYAAWLNQLNMIPIPAHVLKPYFEANGNINDAPWNREPDVVSGPYKFVSWEAGSQMTFVANENSFLGTPKIPNILVQFVPDDATVVSSLVAGDSDVGTFIATGDTPALQDAGVNIELVPSGYNEGWYFNVREGLGHPALQDVNVRKSLIMLFDRDTINKDLNLGLLYTGASFWQEMPYMRPDAKPIPYDPEGAKAMLDAAGWVDSNGDGTRDKDGVELVLRYVTNQRQLRKDIQAIVKQAFEEAGVGVEIFNYDSDIFFAGYADGAPMAIGDYDIGEYSSNPAYPDPDTSRFICSEIPTEEKPDGVNDSGLCDPELDALFAQQASTTDFNARVEIFHQIDQKMADLVVWTNVWYDPDLWAINGRIANTLVSGADPLWNAVNWEITG